MRKWIATFIGLALLVGGTAQGQTSKEPSEGFRADHHWSDVARGAGSASVGARQTVQELVALVRGPLHLQ